MLRRVLARLVREFPHVTSFATISPIPGFNQWLHELISVASIDLENDSGSIYGFSKQNKLLLFLNQFSVSSPVQFLRKSIRKFSSDSAEEHMKNFQEKLFSFSWLDNVSQSDSYKSVLLPLCVYYLLKLKNDKKAFDPVC